jgi:hypothetical protein
MNTLNPHILIGREKEKKILKQLLSSITNSGLKPTMYSTELISNVTTLADLYKN